MSIFEQAAEGIFPGHIVAIHGKNSTALFSLVFHFAIQSLASIELKEQPPMVLRSLTQEDECVPHRPQLDERRHLRRKRLQPNGGAEFGPPG